MSADVDAARAALLSIWLNERQRQAQAEAVARFEAAIRAEGLDVVNECLRMCIHVDDCGLAEYARLADGER